MAQVNEKAWEHGLRINGSRVDVGVVVVSHESSCDSNVTYKVFFCATDAGTGVSMHGEESVIVGHDKVFELVIGNPAATNVFGLATRLKIVLTDIVGVGLPRFVSQVDWPLRDLKHVPWITVGIPVNTDTIKKFSEHSHLPRHHCSTASILSGNGRLGVRGRYVFGNSTKKTAFDTLKTGSVIEAPNHSMMVAVAASRYLSSSNFTTSFTSIAAASIQPASSVVSTVSQYYKANTRDVIILGNLDALNRLLYAILDDLEVVHVSL